MFFFTHLSLAKSIYRYLSDSYELDYNGFLYGNIKPDLPSRNRVHHTLDICLPIVNELEHSLQSEPLTSFDFSVKLGEISHYLCDFFCFYHLNESLHNSSLEHLFYELRLHTILLTSAFKKKHPIIPRILPLRGDTESVILAMRKDYYTYPRIYVFQRDTMKRDLDYAYAISARICDAVLKNASGVSSDSTTADIVLHPVLLRERGIL